MMSDKKPTSNINKTASAAPVSEAASADDEIAEIMSEIQSLQESMASTEQAPAPATSRTKAPEAAVAAVAASDDSLDSLADELAEFRGGGDEPSMEETLGSMKDEEAPTGKTGLLDAAIEDEAHRRPQDDVDTLIEAEMAAEAGRVTRRVEAEADFDSGEGIMPDFSAQSQKADGTLTMMLSGNMTLKLKYEYGDQEVTVSFAEQALRVQLSDGTEFKIPVGRGARLKAA